MKALLYTVVAGISVDGLLWTGHPYAAACTAFAFGICAGLELVRR